MSGGLHHTLLQSYIASFVFNDATQQVLDMFAIRSFKDVSRSGNQLGADGDRSILVDELIRVVDEGELSLVPCFAALVSSLSFCCPGCKAGSSLVCAQDLGATRKRFSFTERENEEVAPQSVEGGNVVLHSSMF